MRHLPEGGEQWRRGPRPDRAYPLTDPIQFGGRCTGIEVAHIKPLPQAALERPPCQLR